MPQPYEGSEKVPNVFQGGLDQQAERALDDVTAQAEASAPVAQPAAEPAAQVQPAAEVQTPQQRVEPAAQAPQQPAFQPPAQSASAPQPPASAYQRPGYQQQAYQQQAYQPGAATSAPYAQPAAAAAPGYQQAYHVQPEVTEKKKSHGWIIAVVIIVCLFLLQLFAIKECSNSLSSMGGAYSPLPAGPAGDSVAIITLDGTIQYDGSACSPEGFKALLDEAADSDDIKAVVLRVNSGGGTATAGEEMATYLRQFEKPVVVSSASINASAAYEISAQADSIYVAKSTEIGAIGTAMQVQDLSGLFEMLGIGMEVITSADSKDSSYGFRPLTDEERAYYQRMIDQINEVFIQNVAEGRSMSVEDVRALATGLSFTGIDAVENGLADEVGTLEDAADKAAELAGISDYELYDLGLTSYDLSSLYSLFGYSQDDSQQALPLLKQ